MERTVKVLVRYKTGENQDWQVFLPEHKVNSSPASMLKILNEGNPQYEFKFVKVGKS